MRMASNVTRLRVYMPWVSGLAMALMLVLSNIAPAGAQSATVGVSTLEAAETSQMSPGDGQQYAQSFSTGSSAVTLEKVRMHMRTEQSNPTPAVSIRADSSGQPGATLHVLTNPSIDSSIDTSEDFTTTGYQLAANTTYWVVVHRPWRSDRFFFSVTSSDSDPAVETGWSLGDNIHIALGNGWNGQTLNRWSIRMAIYTSPAQPGGLYTPSLSHPGPAAKAPSLILRRETP